MRRVLVLVPLSLIATPALAQSAYPAPPAFMPPPSAAIPPVFADPGTLNRLSNAAEAVSRALLDMPVGELRAAVHGREPTARDRNQTLGQEVGITDRDIHSQFQAAKPMVAHGMKAMTRALPILMRTLDNLQGTIDRATANLPDPNYPRR